MITYVCAGCSRIRCKLKCAPWRPENWKRCRCGCCTIRPQIPKEIERSREFFKRPNKTLRRQRQLARRAREKGFYGSVFEEGHPFFWLAQKVHINQFEVDAWNRRRDQRLGYPRIMRKYAEAI